ncbi:MAG TPA: nucleoside triphosphate pyrophosphatase [Gemmatimonadales bacterium]|nr:nucleoside triphosphate pyrophosphatase [Gemmatimonadales bacterium]
MTDVPPADSPIVLASSSPRRRQLLEMLRIPFEVEPSGIDEVVHPGEAPRDYVLRVAREKAEAVGARRPGALVLAADTEVVLDGEVFGKPADAAAAVGMLLRLQGRTHQVLTGVTVAHAGRLEQALDVTAVTFRPADEATLSDYVATGEPLDKAGAYAVQGLGGALIVRIEGDVFGVMGLPLRLVLDLLARLGRPYRFTR